MINGVLHIVAAVLFAVISLDGGFHPIWMGIAGLYLFAGIINLAIRALKTHKIERAARKAEEKNTQKSAPVAAETEANIGG